MQDMKYVGDRFVFARGRWEHPEKSGYRLHAHDTYELLYFVDGQGSYLVEGREYPVLKDSVMVIRPGEVHRLVVDDTHPYERICINFRASLLRGIDPNGLLLTPYTHGTARNHYRIEHGEELLSLLPSLDEGISDDGSFPLAVQLFLFRCLFEIRDRTGQHKYTDNASEPLEPILHHINEHLTEELSLQAVATQFYISPTHLNRLMKQSVGTTFWNYVSVKRLLFAKTLLRQGTPTGEAARLSGFSEYSTFFRAYKKQFGSTPHTDRRKA